LRARSSRARNSARSNRIGAVSWFKTMPVGYASRPIPGNPVLEHLSPQR
jgi:hypothetical protein